MEIQKSYMLHFEREYGEFLGLINRTNINRNSIDRVCKTIPNNQHKLHNSQIMFNLTLTGFEFVSMHEAPIIKVCKTDE